LNIVERRLAEFTRAGVDIAALAARLQIEGEKSFSQSWNDLMSVIATRKQSTAQTARVTSHVREVFLWNM
jgi:transaldolase